MSRRPEMKPELLTEIADQLRSLLDAINADELKASAATRYRIEGAIAALDAASGVDPAAIVESLTHEMDDD